MGQPAELSASHLFHGSGTLKDAAVVLRCGVRKVRALWVEEFGEEAVKARGERVRLAACAKSRSEDESLQEKRRAALEAFDTEESASEVSRCLGITRVTLRRWWNAEHGEEAVKARGGGMLRSNSTLRKGPAARETREEALRAFASDESAQAVADRLGVSRGVVRRWWTAEHGEEAVAERGRRTRRAGCARRRRRRHGPDLVEARREALEVFGTDEGLKEAARRFRVDYRVVRGWWVEEHGEDAVRERLRRVKSARAAQAGKLRRGMTYDLKTREVPCTGCGAPVWANAVSLAKRSEVLCDGCMAPEDAVPCPVCGQVCNGQRGLSAHFRHRREAADASHTVWETAQEEARWADKTEDEDYVRCRECGFRGTTLATHLRTHGLKADEYRARHPGALIRSRKLMEKRSGASVETWAEGRRGGATKGSLKEIVCSDCGCTHRVSRFLVPRVHEIRCKDCLALTKLEKVCARWGGKTEPEDYVTCRECGYRAESLVSHLQHAHPSTDYRAKHAGARVVALGSSVRDKSQLRLNVDEKDLVPFHDEQGRVIVAAAAEHFGCAQNTMKRRCRDLGLPTRNRLAFQKRVLDRVSEVLGWLAYEWEYTDESITNPATGYVLRYDGYFPLVNLLVEAHGRQHEKFVPYWHKTEENFKKRQELDRLKLRRAREEGYAILVVRKSDPEHLDERWLLRRILDIGVAVPG